MDAVNGAWVCLHRTPADRAICGYTIPGPPGGIYYDSSSYRPPEDCDLVDYDADSHAEAVADRLDIPPIDY